jgi:hypothetical protein
MLEHYLAKPRMRTKLRAAKRRGVCEHLSPNEAS